MPYPIYIKDRIVRVRMTAPYLSPATTGRLGRIVSRQPAGALVLLFATAADPDPRACFYSSGAFTEIGEGT